MIIHCASLDYYYDYINLHFVVQLSPTNLLYSKCLSKAAVVQSTQHRWARYHWSRFSNTALLDMVANLVGQVPALFVMLYIDTIDY